MTLSISSFKRMAESRSNWLVTLVTSAFVSALCVLRFSDTVADPDLWGHVRFGQDILRSGVIIQPDSYSYRTAGQPWINHEWLSELCFASVDKVLGPPGIVLLKLVLTIPIFAISNLYFRRHGLGLGRSLMILVIVSVPMGMGLGTIRPQVFTYHLFFIELLLLVGATGDRIHRLWGLPIVFAVWVNLHGGVLAGVGVAGLWILMRMIELIRAKTIIGIRRVVALAHLVILGLFCILALLLNPYGSDLLVFLLRTATVPRPEIQEWKPLALISLPGQFYLVLLMIGVVALVHSQRQRSASSILVLAVTAVLPIIAARHYPLFALVLIVMAGGHIADAWNRWWPPRSMSGRLELRLAAFGLFATVILIGLAIPRLGCIRIDSAYFPFPARAVALLQRSGFQGNVAVPFDWGEYLIWHLGPLVKVSNDGRRETIYSDRVYRDSQNFDRGTGVWDAILNTPPPTDLVLVPNGSPTANLLGRTEGWLTLYQDKFCLIFVRKGLPSIELIVSTPIPNLPDNGEGICFASPSRTKTGHDQRMP